MTPEEIAWLRSSASEEAAASPRSLLTAGESELAVITQLRRGRAPAHARAALALALGRLAAARKFGDWERLFCERDAADQASDELISGYRARRSRDGRRVPDLGCGIAADAVALALVSEVVACDRDPGRVAMATANASVQGLSGRIRVIGSDLESFQHPPELERRLGASPVAGSGGGPDPGAW